MKYKYRIVKYREEKFFALERKPKSKWLCWMPWRIYDYYSTVPLCEIAINQLILKRKDPFKQVIREMKA